MLEVKLFCVIKRSTWHTNVFESNGQVILLHLSSKVEGLAHNVMIVVNYS